MSASNILREKGVVSSPLHSSFKARKVAALQASKLIKDWQQFFGFDIEMELAGTRVIECYECHETGLRFFHPAAVAGGGKLYSNLQKLSWYYMPHKWEHAIALKVLAGPRRVLEVGCGRGEFLERVEKVAGAVAVGLEINEAAAVEAREQGRVVDSRSLEDFAVLNEGGFDAVCLFQVLEHIADPVPFLLACLRCLKPGGKLVIAVPNMDSFIRHVDNYLLNNPPHHMTQWCLRAFRSLERVLPVKFEKSINEPLQKYHVSLFVDTMILVLKKKNCPALIRNILRKFLTGILNVNFVRRFVRGQTIMVLFHKTA